MVSWVTPQTFANNFMKKTPGKFTHQYVTITKDAVLHRVFTKYKIQKGVRIPMPVVWLSYLLRMKKGDSFVCDRTKKCHILNVARRNNIKVISRILPSGKRVRIHRL
jgi:hypothetical protein